MLALYALLIAGAGGLLATSPQGFVPAQDRGYATISIELPGGASLARTTAVVERAAAIVRAVPGVASVSALAGVSGATNTAGSNQGTLTPVFAPWEERLPQGLTAARILRADQFLEHVEVRGFQPRTQPEADILRELPHLGDQPAQDVAGQNHRGRLRRPRTGIATAFIPRGKFKHHLCRVRHLGK
jgi:multidrug efflux pump subunit AcrB